MATQTLRLKNDVINSTKLFWSLVAFEALLFAIMFVGDYFFFNDLIFFGICAGVFIVPLFLVFTPIEPSVGLVFMLIATGFDFLGRISKSTGEVNFNFTYFHLAFLITVVGSFLNMTLKRRIVIRSASIWPPFTMFIFVLSYSLIYAPNFIDAAIVFTRITMMGLIILIVIESIDKVWKVHMLMWSMVIVPVAIAVLTMYQLLTEGAFYAPQVSKVASSLGIAVYRSTGTFDNPNKLACFLMIGVIIPVAILFVKKVSMVTRIILFIAISLTSAGILSTFSRAGWLSIIAGMFVIVALNRKWWFFGAFFIVIIIGTIILSIKVPQMWEVIFDRFASMLDPANDDSSSSRLSLIKSGIWMWQDHPLFGIGLRGFPEMYYDYVDPNMPYMLIHVREPHTIQFEILAEEGLIGLCVATWMFFTVLFHGLKTALTLRHPFLKSAQIGFLALFCAYIVNFTFATDISNNVFWMTVGMMYAIPNIDEDLQEETTGGGDVDSERPPDDAPLASGGLTPDPA